MNEFKMKMYQKNYAMAYVLAEKNIRTHYHTNNNNSIYMANSHSNYTPKQPKYAKYHRKPDEYLSSDCSHQFRGYC